MQDETVVRRTLLINKETLLVDLLVRVAARLTEVRNELSSLAPGAESVIADDSQDDSQEEQDATDNRRILDALEDYSEMTELEDDLDLDLDLDGSKHFLELLRSQERVTLSDSWNRRKAMGWVTPDGHPRLLHERIHNENREGTCRRLMVDVCKYLYAQNPNRLRAMCTLLPHRLLTQPGSQSKQIADGLWVFVKLSQTEMRRLIRDLLTAYAIPENSVEFYLRSEYAAKPRGLDSI